CSEAPQDPRRPTTLGAAAGDSAIGVVPHPPLRVTPGRCLPPAVAPGQPRPAARCYVAVGEDAGPGAARDSPEPGAPPPRRFRGRSLQPSFGIWGARSGARVSGGTSRVMTEPAPT